MPGLRGWIFIQLGHGLYWLIIIRTFKYGTILLEP